MGEYRIGWMSHDVGAVINWDVAVAVCESWAIDEVRALGPERAALFAGQTIESQLVEDLNLVRAEFEHAVRSSSERLAHVVLWGHEAFVAEDDEQMILALSRLHAVGALTAAGFSDEF